jgi:hypothetical protein
MANPRVAIQACGQQDFDDVPELLDPLLFWEHLAFVIIALTRKAARVGGERPTALSP